MDNYKRSIEKMEEFVNNQSPSLQEEAINGIRLTLELILKIKYCKYIQSPNITFGQIIDELERSSCSFVNPNKSDVIAKLRDLNSISWKTHHASVDERAVYREVSLTTTEAVNYVNKALDMLNREL